MNKGLGHKQSQKQMAAADALPAAPEPSCAEERVDHRIERPGIRALVAVTGSASNAGKTWLMERLLEGFKDTSHSTFALKVTRTHVDTCPRENDACGVCDDLATPWNIITDPALIDVPRKDTGRYVAAGADRVAWLLVQPPSVAGGLRAVLPLVPDGWTLFAEGNSFRDHIDDANVTLMAVTADESVKPSAEYVLDRVDAFVCRREEMDGLRKRFAQVAGGRPWVAAEDAAAWVLERI